MKFDTAPEFASGLKSHPTVITHDQCDSAASAIQKTRGFIIGNLTLPILIFLEKYDDDALVTPIRNLCSVAGIYFEACSDDDTLRVLSNEVGAKSNGVFIFPKVYGRGIDFKFQTDAKVLILMNGDLKLTTADVHQMAGRGTRSQGIPSATIIMIGAKLKVGV